MPLRPAARTFRLFVSSTFSDFVAERDALQDHVFPRLRELCTAHGARFQAIDLRWGISEQAALDQQTMPICLQEIARCQQLTPQPNFVLLLGDRYGWCPLPAEIPADEFLQLSAQIHDADEQGLLAAWYRRDDNAVPPRYCLQPRGGEFQKYAHWEAEVERPLRQALRRAAAAAGLSPQQQELYGISATAQEIAHGIFQVANAHEHVFCFFRAIEGLPEDDRSGAYLDLDPQGRPDRPAQAQLKQLKARLRQLLPGHIHDYTAQWTGTDITTDHLEPLCADVYADLSRIIEVEIARAGQEEALEREVAAHAGFAAERARLFIGRAYHLQSIAAHLSADARRPLVAWGASGTGKSALLARAAQQARAASPNARLIQRFIGSTPESSSGRALLEGLCREIARAYGADETSTPGDFLALQQDWPRRLALATPQQPLFLFLDGLDQLAPADPAASLSWLPSDLPRNVHLVVSTLPGPALEALRQRLPAESFLEVGPMPADEGAALLDAWLQEAGRTLQPSQRQEVLDKFSRCGLPLFLRLAMETARGWKSYTPPPDLPADVCGMISDLLNRLSTESAHGPALVERSLSYLAAARNGLSEDELLDLLSSDTEVQADFRRRSPRSPQAARLPVVVWSRLFLDLQPYLAQRSADGTALLSFYHRQMEQVVAAIYLRGATRAERHRTLARYFAAQPLWARGVPGDAPNLRQISELPFQQAHGELWNDLRDTLSDIDFLYGKVAAVGPRPLIEDYDEAFRAGLQDKDLIAIHDALRLCANVVAADPDQLPSQIIGRLPPSGRPTTDAFLERVRAWRGRPWLQPCFPTLIAAGGNLLRTLTGHDGWVSGVAVTPDGRRAVSCSDDATVRLWDMERAIEVRTLTDHDGPVRAVAVTPDGRRAVSASADETLIVWDLDQGIPWRTLRGHDNEVLAVTLFPDGQRAISASADGTLKVWDLQQGSALRTLRGHRDWVRAVILAPDGRRAISGADDGDIHIWDLEQGTLLDTIHIDRMGPQRINGLALLPDGKHLLLATPDRKLQVVDMENKRVARTLRGHGDWVRAVLALSDGRAISASDDHTLRVWDTESGKELSVLDGHTKAVWGVAATADGQQVVSASGDGTLKVWDIARCLDSPALLAHPHWSVHGLAFTPDGRRLISAGGDNTVKVWDVASGCELATLTGHEASVVAVAVTPDGRRAVSGSWDKTVRVWDLERNLLLHTLQGHTSFVFAVAVTPDGRRAISASRDHSLSLWDIETGVEVRPLVGHYHSVNAVAIFPTGRQAISASYDRTLRLWDLESGREVGCMRTGETFARSIAVTPDGLQALTAMEDGTLRTWDLQRLREAHCIQAHTGIAWAVTLTPDGRHAISGSEDQTLRVWRREEGQLLATFTAESSIHCCAAAPDGHTIACGEHERFHVLRLRS